MDARRPVPGSAWVVAGLTILASTGAGFVLGALAEMFYGGREAPPNVGWVSGIVAGLLVGAGYVLTLLRNPVFGQWDGRAVWLGTLAGVVAGVAAAVVVHVALMCTHERWEPLALPIGALFGVGAGAILGLISSSLFYCCFKARRPDSNTEV